MSSPCAICPSPFVGRVARGWDGGFTAPSRAAPELLKTLFFSAAADNNVLDAKGVWVIARAAASPPVEGAQFNTCGGVSEGKFWSELDARECS